MPRRRRPGGSDPVPCGRAGTRAGGRALAAILERPEDATLRTLARAARSEAAICDLGAEVDRVWARLLPADRDMLRYHLRAAGVAATLRRAIALVAVAPAGARGDRDRRPAPLGGRAATSTGCCTTVTRGCAWPRPGRSAGSRRPSRRGR